MATISLCMIVKNEEAVLGRVLEQMQGVADEIVVVDTGSTDRTKEIAGHFTDLVYDFEWQQDFSAARNFACSKASMDYWMWLDADDMVRPDQQELLIKLKHTLNPDTDVVMMKYLTGFDKDGKVTFSYYRERLIKNNHGFLWQGKVHEAVTPSGSILYSPIEIEHRKEKEGDSDRNLKIYEGMLANGEQLEPRHQFYYGRELYYHKQYEKAVQIFRHFLTEPGGWVENQIDACLQMSYCYGQMDQPRNAILSLTNSFLYDAPRAEICCELGRHFMEDSRLHQAMHWYLQALVCKPRENSGGFVLEECYGFIPCIQLCVCHDMLGDHARAYEYHKLAAALKPEDGSVKQNQAYFESILELEKNGE